MQTIDVEIFKPTAKVELAFTAATTDIFTATAHGLSEGDCLQFTTATTLPAGLSLTTNYYVIGPITADTFKVSATPHGPTVNITDTGTGTHTYHLKGKVVYVGDYDVLNVSLSMSGTPTMTVKFQGSDSLSAPDFNAAQSTTNEWDYIDVIDEEDGASIDGDTGVATTGTADYRKFSINTDRKQWISVQIFAWTDGELGIKLAGYAK